MEARYGRVPLLVLTADRPHKFRDAGALQTIDQIKLFGDQVKWFVEMAPPDPSLEGYVKAVAARAFTAATQTPPGPVHLNFPFGEPLTPPNVDVGLERGLPASGRKLYDGEVRLSSTDLDHLAASLDLVERGLIVCGPQDDPTFPTAITALSEATGFPILAEAFSQVRSGQHDRSRVVDCYDIFLRNQRVVQSLIPEVVLRFGSTPVSKPLQSYLDLCQTARHISVGGGLGWSESEPSIPDRVHADPSAFASDLAASLKARNHDSDDVWLHRWLALAARTRVALDLEMAVEMEVSEPKVAYQLSRLLEDQDILFVGNSMPLRDVDSYFPGTTKSIRFLGNRGVNGIDGVISSALGAAAGSPNRVLLLIGDLSFYHDMNGLLAAKLHSLNATIVLINNDGGGIFQFLPQATLVEGFEANFIVSTGLDFKPMVEMYGGRFHSISSWECFDESVSLALASPGLDVLEVRTNREENVLTHQRLVRDVAQDLDRYLDQTQGDREGLH